MFELDHIIPPPTAFYFNVQFLAPFPIPDMAFLEVSGLTMELETTALYLYRAYRDGNHRNRRGRRTESETAGIPETRKPGM